MSREYCDYILDLLSPIRGVTAKRMFGGFGLFRGGLMFGLIAEDILYLKVGPLNRKDFEDLGAGPFIYRRKGEDIALSYWAVPLQVLDDESELMPWAEKAYKAAIAAQDGKKKKKKKA